MTPGPGSIRQGRHDLLFKSLPGVGQRRPTALPRTEPLGQLVAAIWPMLLVLITVGLLGLVEDLAQVDS